MSEPFVIEGYLSFYPISGKVDGKKLKAMAVDHFGTGDDIGQVRITIEQIELRKHDWYVPYSRDAKGGWWCKTCGMEIPRERWILPERGCPGV